MSTTRIVRCASAAGLALAVLGGVAAQAAPRAPKPGPNLVANPGFEESAFEGPAAPPGSLAQPLLPTAWSFEGLTILFDHTPNVYNSGKRAAAISGSLSGPDKICPDPATCVDNPTKDVKKSVSSRYHLAPHWRTASAIPVTAGTTYSFTHFLSWAQITIGQGSVARVRWVDAGGATVSEDVQAKLATPDTTLDLPWAKQTMKVKAPAGATGAVLMLGQTDDLWTGQTRYDDVHFGTA